MPCYSPLKGWRNSDTGGIVFKQSPRAYERMEVACGQCLGCRTDKSRMWASRIMHEASLYDENCFVTLTYDDEHLPSDGSLNKAHFQKFLKRLRKRFGDRRIRYYHCGEYGAQLYRPHYHACFFNLDFPDKELFHEREGNLLFVSQTLSELWADGFSTVGELTFQSAAYCARYVTKKVTGKARQDHYLRLNIETGELYMLQPEYSTMSRRPGIGRGWYEKFKTDCFPSDEVPVPGVGVLPKVPRYYEEIYQLDDPVAHGEVKEARQCFRRAHAEEYTPERLMAKYKVHKAKMAMLKRGLEDEA